MSGRYVLSSDCIAAVESCITLCGKEERKDQTQLNLSQKLYICQKCFKSFNLFGHQLALLLEFIFSLFFQTVNFQVLEFKHFFCFDLPFVDSVLLVVDCALFDPVVCGQQCCTYTLLSVPSSAVHIR
jgi:hypothetical protein